jgi:hypothetical protein
MPGSAKPSPANAFHVSPLRRSSVILALVVALTSCAGAKNVVINGKTYLQRGSELFLPGGGAAVGYCTITKCYLD